MSLDFLINENMIPRMEELIEAGENLPVDEIAQLLIDSVHENFLQEGRPGPWAPRVESPYDDGHPILRDTGDLYNSIQAMEVSQEEIIIDSDLDYAGYNDQGTSRAPARPFLVIQDSDADEIEDLLAQHFNFEE
jgi:phage gpG-like protein